MDILEDLESVKHKRQIDRVLAQANDLQIDFLTHILHEIAFERRFTNLNVGQKRTLSVYTGKSYKSIKHATRKIKVYHLLALGIGLQKVIASNIGMKWLKSAVATNFSLQKL